MSLNHKATENGQEMFELFSHYFSSDIQIIIFQLIRSTKKIESNDSINKLHIDIMEVFNEQVRYIKHLIIKIL